MSDLMDYFRGIDDMKYLCWDFLECFDNEQRAACDSPKYDLLMEKKSRINERKSRYDIRNDGKLCRNNQAAERERIELIKRIEKKPKASKDD
ncbi:hypothetical protein ENUP19_0332G0017 [Entamoeba nuttalli]|uniref:Uncharacterized protein n=1 Tax=Entamoeba nuttalli TaxID=412467 RepID=A0ABQ0DWU2_9EUKA